MVAVKYAGGLQTLFLVRGGGGIGFMIDGFGLKSVQIVDFCGKSIRGF